MCISDPPDRPLSVKGFGMPESVIVLPPPRQQGGMALLEAIARRRTIREIGSGPLPPQTLSDLCYAAAGVNAPDGRRTIATARNVQDLVLYVAMPQGLYRYDAAAHRLLLERPEDVRPFCGEQHDMHANAAVVLIYVSDLRVYDGVITDPSLAPFYAGVHAGSASQNVYLYATANRLATVVCNWIDKPSLKTAMQLPPDLHIQLTQPVGPVC